MLRSSGRQWRSAMARATPARTAANATSREFSAAASSSPLLSLKRGDGCAALQVGETYQNFILKRKQRVPEYNIEALELEHIRTKASYVHIDAKDTNNVFSVMFRTPPYSSNGIAHILEHTVLCGSQKYPVRDPFFNMIKRSLNTYMNALTAYDHTMYPFSTVNDKDWQNLRSVYCDAVFAPLLEKLDFLQEGHRLEIVDNAKNQGELELQYKGVVYNEMKGVLSDANNLFATRVQQELLKGTIYGHVSGGEPASIPQLTYEELKQFHKKHYHPSNACFYSYGDMSLTDHLQFLDQEILAKFEFQEDSASVRVDAASAPGGFDIFSKEESKLVVVEGPASNMGGEGERDPNMKFCMSQFVKIPSTDPFETFVMRIVGYLLTNGPSSPLYKALIDSELAQDFAVGTGFDTSTFYATFGIGVEGIEGENAIPVIENAVKTAYEGVVEKGFEKDRVEALLHQLELTQKHIQGNFGMNLMHGMSSVWTHRGDVLANLQLNPLLEKLQQKMVENPKFLENYIQKHLLDDQKNGLKHVSVLMKPSENYVKDQELLESQRLADTLMEASNDDLDAIARTTKQLDKYQKKPQPVECLPTLTVSDIPKFAEKGDVIDSITLGSSSPIEAQFVKVPTTNGISYMRVLCDTSPPRVPLEYQLYLPLFTSVFGSLGTSRLRHDALATEIQNASGGISCSGLTHPSLVDAAGSSKQSLLLGTLCLPHKMEQTLQILVELMTDTQFCDPENLKQLRIILQMEAANASNAISSSGASLAGTRARVGLTHSALYDELYGGLTHIEQLQKWAQASDQELLEIAQILQNIARVVFTPDNLKLSIVTEENLRNQVENTLEQQLLSPLAQFSSSGGGAPSPSSVLPLLPALPPLVSSPRSFYGFPVSVNFVVETMPSVAFAHPDHVPLSVLAQIMSSCFLHQLVREQGGAYGSGVSQGEGTFSLSSHYDPNTTKTLEAYEKALLWAAKGEFSERDIQEALLSIFASIDSPRTPSMKGKMSFLRGITNEMRQQRREQYLALTKPKLVEIANHFFAEKPPSQIVIIGKESETKEMEKQFFEIKSVST